MFALEVEVVGAGGVGEGGRVTENEVVLVALCFQPGQGVGLHHLVRVAAQAVFTEVVGQPLQVGG